MRGSQNPNPSSAAARRLRPATDMPAVLAWAVESNSGHFGIHSITPFRRSVLLDPLVPDLRRRATSSRCRGARAGDCRDLLQQCFLRLRQIERITVGLMISGASVPVDLDQIFFRISEIKGE